MLNVFSVVVAYSITCPLIVPFGESPHRHTQGCTPSVWKEEELSPTISGHAREKEKTQGGMACQLGRGVRARARARSGGGGGTAIDIGRLLSECMSE